MATPAGERTLWVVPPAGAAAPAADLSGAGAPDDEGATPAAFVRLVREALAALFDPVALRRNPLAELAARDPACASARVAGGEALRRCLLDAIEALVPPPAGRPAPPSGWNAARARRLQHLLQLRYVEGLDAPQVQRQLGIGKTQYYREHERAVAAVAGTLHHRWRQGEAVPVARRTEPRLPDYLTTFVGRERERAELARLLATTRLLTLTGPGGTGKTRLASHVASHTQTSWEDGARFVDMAAVADPGRVESAVANVLDVREETSRPLIDTLADALAGKHLLLILDNCEHLVNAAAALVEALLQACPGLTVLATSREALGVAGEVVWPVPPLGLPPAEKTAHQPKSAEALLRYEAIRLFVERAKTAQPAFACTAETAPAVAAVCAQLDGIPLAIELAAARLRGLSIGHLAQRLETGLRLLTGGSRTAVPRQQTLAATIEWSYSLLSEPEQALFTRLSVFAGGWTLEAAEEVCAGDSVAREAIPDLLLRLVDKSLVVAQATESGVERYRLLETLRQYGREKFEASGDAARVRHRHATVYLALAERAAPMLIGPRQAEWLARLHMEHANVQAALGWMLAQGEAERALRLSSACWRFWEVRGLYREGRRWLELSLAEAGVVPVGVRAKALHAVGTLSFRQSDFPAARTFLEQSLALRRELGDKQAIASTLLTLGLVATQQGEYAAGRERYEESLAVAREQGDTLGIASALNNLGSLAYRQGEYAIAHERYTESLALKRELGDKWGIANTLSSLGLVWTQQGEYAAARTGLEESLALYHELGNMRGIAAALNNLGSLAYKQGEYATARERYAESLALKRELGDKWGIADLLTDLGHLAQQENDVTTARRSYAESLALAREVGAKSVIAVTLAGLSHLLRLNDRAAAVQAARLLGAAAALRAAMGVPVPPSERDRYEQTVAAVQLALGEDAFRAAWAGGQRMTLDETVIAALKAVGDSGHGAGG